MQCLRMQLALDNALAPFFENNFGFGITKAANLAAIFGMMNFFARPLGGLISDLMARRFGMRGRLWWLFSLLACGGGSYFGTTSCSRSAARSWRYVSFWHNILFMQCGEKLIPVSSRISDVFAAAAQSSWVALECDCMCRFASSSGCTLMLRSQCVRLRQQLRLPSAAQEKRCL